MMHAAPASRSLIMVLSPSVMHCMHIEVRKARGIGDHRAAPRMRRHISRIRAVP
jgi:hypothetical protein